MRSTCLSALAAIAFVMCAGAASAQQMRVPHLEPTQLPPPFGPRGTMISGPQKCTPPYQRLLKLQIEAMKQLQVLSRTQGETLCTSIEGADELGVDKLLDPKALDRLLSPEQREALQAFGIDVAKADVGKIMRLLGVDISRIDLRQLRHQCRQSQGEVDRYATNELGRLEREFIRCDDRI